MAVNRILGSFRDADLNEEEALRPIDWPGLGVELVYMIAFTGRCGSTWLTHIVEDSGNCGRPHEYFNLETIPFYNKTPSAPNFLLYYNWLLANKTTGGRFGYEITPDRLRDLIDIFGFDRLFPQKNKIIFWITRDDIIAQAYSFARAKKSGHWHDYTTYSQGSSSPDLVVEPHEIWAEVVRIAGQERLFEEIAKEFDIRPILLSYERMVTDKRSCAMMVLSAISGDRAATAKYVQAFEDRTKQMQSGAKYETLASFYETYWELVVETFRSRATLTPVRLRAELKSRYGVIV